MASTPELPAYDEDEAVERWASVLFNPPRANLERALGVPDPPDRAPKGLTVGAWRAWREAQAIELAREHWENLVTRGLVPPECLEDPHRRFVGTKPEHRPDRGKTSTTYVQAIFSHPPTVDAAIAIASDMGNALAVEELAREWQRRTASFFPPPYASEYRSTKGILWDVGPAVASPSSWSLPEPYALGASLVARFAPPEANPYAALQLRTTALTALPRSTREWVQHAVLTEKLEGLLVRARELGLPWAAPPFDAPWLARFADYIGVTSPYTTTLEILRRGYALVGFGGTYPGLRVVGLCN